MKGKWSVGKSKSFIHPYVLFVKELCDVLLAAFGEV